MNAFFSRWRFHAAYFTPATAVAFTGFHDFCGYWKRRYYRLWRNFSSFCHGEASITQSDFAAVSRLPEYRPHDCEAQGGGTQSALSSFTACRDFHSAICAAIAIVDFALYDDAVMPDYRGDYISLEGVPQPFRARKCQDARRYQGRQVAF